MVKKIFLGYLQSHIYMTGNGLHYTDNPSFKILLNDVSLDSEDEVDIAFNKAMDILSNDLRKNRPVKFFLSDDFGNYFNQVKSIISNYYTKADVLLYTKP